MSSFAIASTLQIINALLLIVWVIMAVVTLFQLRGKNLPATPKAIWALIILGIPILGAVAFFIVKPEDNSL